MGYGSANNIEKALLDLAGNLLCDPPNAQDQRRAKAKNDRQALSPRPLNLDVRLISIQKGYSCVERTLQDQRSHLFGATTGQFGTIKKTWKIVAVPTSSIFIIKTCNTSSNSAPL